MESVEESKPMANFVSYGLSKVVVGGRATGDGRVENGATVVIEVV